MYLKLIPLLVIYSFAFAQNISPSILVCDGNYFDYQIPEIRNLPFKGGVIRIGRESVLISGFAGFTGNQERLYSITNNTASFIEFVDLKNQNFTGSVGRYSGQFFLNEFIDRSKSKVNKFAEGYCHLKERLF